MKRPPAWQMTAKQNFESYKETLQTAANFSCACCGLAKPRGEATGPYHYEPTSSDLAKRMIAPAVYALCQECKDNVAPDIKKHNITATLAKQGLFRN